MIKVGTRLIKCTEPDALCRRRDVRKGDVFTVTGFRERGDSLSPSVKVLQERLKVMRLMYVDKHFVRDDGTYSTYKLCLWEVL